MNFKKVLVLSPHTDDAELGAGGFIYKLLNQGAEIFWIVFSIAEDSLPKELPSDTLKIEFKNVLKAYNIMSKNSLILNYPVRKLINYRQEILELLVNTKNQFNPDLVIGPSLNDFHQDHQTVANEMIRAFKSSSSILLYELPWNHINFNSTFFVSLTEQEMKMKLKILEEYKSQINLKRKYFMNDFVKSLAIAKGCQINANYAEAFEVVRLIYK